MSLKLILFVCLIITPCLKTKQKHRFTLVLDPAGDAHNQRRQIQVHYERTITMQCIQALKKERELESSVLLILFTRLPGQQIDQLEKARFANQLPANLYIALYIYETTQLKNQLHIYYYANQQLPCSHVPCEQVSCEHVSRAHEQLTCIPLHKAHLVHEKQTKQSAHHLKNRLSDPTFQRQCELHSPIGLPCLPCKGIIAPALCIEIGLNKPDDWMCCLKPLTQAIYTLCLDLNNI